MDFLKVITIILFILLTIFTIKIHPDMHQPMIIEDADFKLTRISDTISTKNLPSAKTVKTSQPQTIAKKEQRVARTNSPDATSQVELLQQLIKQAEQEEAVELEKPVKSDVKQQTTNKNPYMTEQEEIIAWNIWRSNLQNQIMRDSQIDYAPLGTLFMFTFVVDKFGNVSNIKVECSNPNYMDVVRNRVKPAIANLQRKPILKFPRGSQRTSTVVIGGFIIGTEERYASPENYSDYERITY